MKRRIFTFILGGMCFIVSQILLRIPILSYLQGTSKFTLFYRLNPLLTGILIAFSAGVFEESFRFIFKIFFLKPPKTNILEPIIFGLGHGLTETFILLTSGFSTIATGDLKIAIIERFLTIIFHIGLTVIVWNGFQLNKRIKYLLLAILVHGLLNSLIPIFSPVKNFIILFESLFLLINIFIVFYIYKSRKNYLGGEII